MVFIFINYLIADSLNIIIILIMNALYEKGMPIRCHVDENKGTFVTAYGSGLYFGGSGKEGHFEVASGGG